MILEVIDLKEKKYSLDLILPELKLFLDNYTVGIHKQFVY